MSGLSNLPRRRSSKPSIPNLHIVINDRVPRSAASELDSGYQSAVSACTRDQRMNDAPEQSPLVLEPVTIPDNSMFTTTDPFGTQRQSPPPDRPSPIAEEPSSLMVPPRKNHKKLSLTSLDACPKLRPVTSNMSMQSVAPNTVPMSLPPSPHQSHCKLSMQFPHRSAIRTPGKPHPESLPTRRRSSVMSLPPPTTYPAAPRSKYTTGRRAIEDEGDGDAYANGPVEILPGVWLGAEDNANNWPVLAERSIAAVLNVAKEVILLFEEEPNHPKLWQGDRGTSRGNGRLYPANEQTGRPELVYLHLPWSHGQNDLVNTGFVQAMAFIDRCRTSNLGVLIHCQLGISRSATLAIAYVMRSAHSPSAPSHITKLQKEGMQGAYNFVKSKSQTIGPNMSLIYQLLEYERFLSPDSRGPGSDTSVDSAEAEWTRQRMAMDLEEQEEASRTTSPDPLSDGTTAIEAAEARELDQRMIARRDQRSSSRASSLLSVSVSDGQNVGANGNGTWKSRFGHGLAPQHSGGYRARGLSSGSDISFASGRSSLVSGDSLVLEENEDENADLPWFHSRKDSGDLGNACDETFVLAPAPTRPPTTSILHPLPPARTRGGKASPLSLPASGRSSPALSRRSSELSADQTSFGASQLLPPPSARPDQMGFASQIGSSSSGPNQTSFGFPSISSRRRSADAPSLGPPPVRSARLSNSSCLGPLDTVPPSPVRASDQEQEPPTNAFPRMMEKKSKPAPLRLPVQARSESLKIIATSSEASLSESQSSNGSSSSLTSEGAGSLPANETTPRNVKRKDRTSKPRISRPPHLNVIGSATPHQTLFIFPPSPQRTGSVLSPDSSVLIPSTPSTMLLRTTAVVHPTSVVRSAGWRAGGCNPSSSRSSSRCSSTTTSVSSIDTPGSSVTSSSSRRRRVSALPSGITPTLAAFRQLHFGTPASPSTPTTATAHVAARGWVGLTAAPGHSRTTSAELLGPLSPSTARPPRSSMFGL